MQLTHRGDGTLAAPKHPFVLGGSGYVLTIVIGFIAVAFANLTQATFAVDVWVHDTFGAGFAPVAEAIALLDKPIVVTFILLGLGVLVAQWRGWLAGIAAIWVAGGGWLAIALMKWFVHEPRPTGTFDPAYLEHDYSFPSGHTAFVTTVTVAIVASSVRWSGRWVAAWIGAALVLLTALTRLYLGVHYPVDVVGGMLGGASAAVLMVGIWNALAPTVFRT